jgi:hypothetical protein
MAVKALEVAANEKAYTSAQKADLATNVIRVIGGWK